MFPTSRIAILTACLISLQTPVSAAGPGTSAATFLNLGFGARPLALGEAFVALADDVSALHYNPAGLAYSQNPTGFPKRRQYEMLVSHALHIQDIRVSQMGLVSRPWGFSVTHLGLDGIEARTSESEQPDSIFGASDLMVAFSYGKRVGGVGLGFTGKYIKQNIGQFSASAYAVDLGALYRMKEHPVSFGASIVNLGTAVRFIEQGSPLPRTIRLGATYGLSRRFPHALSLQFDLPRDGAPIVRLGMEYVGFGPFSLRAGYRTSSGEQRRAALGSALGTQAPGLAEFYGMFMGVGFRTKLGSMDYALLPFGELGNAHRFSFSLRFGKSTPKGPIGVFK